jgi:hypothetical protein
MIIKQKLRSRDSSVGIAAGYGIGFESKAFAKFLLLHIYKTGSEDHPASNRMGTRGDFLEGKAAMT